MSEIYKMNASELSRMIHQKEAKPSEICAAFLSRHEAVNPKINAYTNIDSDAALKHAKELDEMPITAETPAMFGLPVAIKDNICTHDLPTTCASKMLEKFRSPYDATVITRLREQGAVILGKTNMDEFAMGSGLKESAFGRVCNPHDAGRVPGGSSSGSGAAVAAGSALFALGSDTGGSIRLPAAFCGAVGYKPTYGAVSRYGVVGYACSFDQVGPIARTVSDAALLTSAIVGHDPMDATSHPSFIPDFSTVEAFSVKNKKIGILKECFEGVSEDVQKALNLAIQTYTSAGAEVQEISIPLIKHSLSIYCIIALAEASSNFAKYDGLRYGHRSDHFDDIDSLYINSRTEGFGTIVKQRIWTGTYILSAGNYDRYYKKARIAQAMLRDQFKKIFETVDVIFTPVSPITAPKYGEQLTDSISCLMDQCTVPVNLAGLPAIAVPCGKDNNQLPIGFQLIGRRFEDASLLGFARVFEKETGISNLVAEVLA